MRAEGVPAAVGATAGSAGRPQMLRAACRTVPDLLDLGQKA
jgi:hypothetical protein